MKRRNRWRVRKIAGWWVVERSRVVGLWWAVEAVATHGEAVSLAHGHAQRDPAV